MLPNMAGFGVFDTLLNDLNPWQNLGKTGQRNKLKNARWWNYVEFRNWFFYFLNLYVNQFEWKNMPDSVNTRFLEYILTINGKALFFEDPNLGYLALPGHGMSGFNVYYEYTRYRAVSIGYDREMSRDDCILIRENEQMYPPFFMIESYCQKISDAGRSIDVFAATMKRPFAVTTSQDTKLSFDIMVDEIMNNEVIVGTDKWMDAGKTNMTPLRHDGAGLMALWRHKHELLDEFYTWMGINNANTEKRERLITSEVESNNQLVKLNSDNALDWRKKAAEEINERFNLNVTVDLKHNYLEEQEGDNGEMDDDPRGDKQDSKP